MVQLSDTVCSIKGRKKRAWIVFGSVFTLLIFIPTIIYFAVRRPSSGGSQEPDVSDEAPSASPTVGTPPAPTSPAPTTPTPTTPATTTPAPTSPVPSSYPSASPSVSTPAPSQFVSTSPILSPAPSYDPEGEALQALMNDGISYRPGFLNVVQEGLILSEGLTSRIIARSGQRVRYEDGSLSEKRFHSRPDFGACFPVPPDATENPGGWVYVSNSEMEAVGKGGVGAITFDKDGNVIDYKMILTGTTMNCGGGKTAWDTWISCEEVGDKGRVYQVDPFGLRESQPITMGEGRGRFESFAYDFRDPSKPYFFVSEDQRKGALRRWTPDIVDLDNRWEILHGKGTLDFLVLEPDSPAETRGTYRWTSNHGEAKLNAELYYPNTEGVDVDGNLLFLVSKTIKKLFILNLDDMTYKRHSTVHGMFDGTPDQVKRILDDEGEHDMLYFTEENGPAAGVHGRNSAGQFFTILEGPGFSFETTGLSFSPDGKHMYFAFQDDGVVLDVWRVDGLPFHGKTLNVRYHNKATLMS